MQEELFYTKNDVKQMLAKNTQTTADVLYRRALGAIAGMQFGQKRDMYEILGYDNEITLQAMLERYQRHDIARTIVNKPAETTWRREPTIQEQDNPDSPWSESLKTLFDRTNFFHFCEKADRLAGIGGYGVLFLGFAGSADIARAPRVSDISQLRYVRAFSRDNLHIAKYNKDTKSERFGFPEQYRITTRQGHTQSINTVHWQRVIHIPTEYTDDNEVIGLSRMQPVWNLLDDLMKIVGGSAEMFWLNARPGIAVETDPDYSSLITPEDKEDIADEVEDYQHNSLSRFMHLIGSKVNQLDVEVASPKDQFDMIMTVIAAVTNIPKRILMGSERGELASSQDAESWYGFISGRQFKYAEPEILRPTIDRLMRLGAIEEREYEVVWPDLVEKDDVSSSEVLENLATTLEKIGNFTMTTGQQLDINALFQHYFGEDFPELLQADGQPKDSQDLIDEVMAIRERQN
jgi:hypothetical protein